MPHAWDISVAETMALLENEFHSTAEAVARDTYALWLGSGISLKKMPKLQVVADTVLRHLHEACNPADPNCRFAATLMDVLSVAPLSDDEWKKVNLAEPIDSWLDMDAVSSRLINQYSSMMDQAPEGEDSDYLLWTAVDVVATYANPTITPGAEHLSVAALIMEGAVSEIASANWDGLVEKAVEELSGGAQLLNVVVLPEDTRKPSTLAQLFKFHGCAVLAEQTPAVYRERLVARKTQIDGWIERGENKVIGSKLIEMVTTKPTLMLGLSAQDTNIQGIFVAAQQRMSWPWPSDPPAFVFSEDQVGINQKGLLTNVYSANITPANKTTVQQSSLLRSFGKALLPALWLHVLGSKFSALVEIGASHLGPDERARLRMGVLALRDAAAAVAVVDQEEAFCRQTTKAFGRAVSLFRSGEEPTANSPIYHPISQTPVQKLVNDPLISTSGLGEASVALGLIGVGTADCDWSVSAGDALRPGAIKITSPSHASQVFFAATTQSALQLKNHGHVLPTDNAVIVHSHPLPEELKRSPRAIKKRKGKPALREVSVRDLPNVGITEMLDFFRSEISL